MKTNGLIENFEKITNYLITLSEGSIQIRGEPSMMTFKVVPVRAWFSVLSVL